MLLRPNVVFAAAGTALPRNKLGACGIQARRDALVKEVANSAECAVYNREPAYWTDRGEAELWGPCEDECGCQRF